MGADLRLLFVSITLLFLLLVDNQLGLHPFNYLVNRVKEILLHVACLTDKQKAVVLLLFVKLYLFLRDTLKHVDLR